MFIDALLKAQRRFARLFRARLHDHHKLVARIAPQEVHRTNLRNHHPNQLLEHLIARLMAELVIHRLEAIEIHQQQRKGVAVAARAVGFFFKAIAQGARVRQSG